MKVDFRVVLIAACCACTPDTNMIPGQVDSITDAAFFPCTPYPASNEVHSCIALTTYHDQVKVLDATVRQFVLGPNGYSPLGVLTGGSSMLAAGHKLFPFVFAFDSGEQQAFSIRSLFDEQRQITFGKPLAQTIPAGLDSAAFYESDDAAQSRLFLAIREADNSKLSSYAVNINSGEISKVSDLTSPGHPATLRCIDSSSKRLVVAFDGGKQFSVYDLASETAPPPTTSTTGDIFSIACGQVQGQFVTAVSTREDQTPTLTIYAPDNKHFTASFPSSINALYIPPGTSKPCCGEVQSWIAALTIEGKFYYIPIDLSSKDMALKPQEAFSFAKDPNMQYIAAGSFKIVGGDILGAEKSSCPRRLYALFHGGVIAESCEGKASFSRIEPPL